MNNIQLESYLKKYHAQIVCADDLPVLSNRLKNEIWIVIPTNAEEKDYIG